TQRPDPALVPAPKCPTWTKRPPREPAPSATAVATASAAVDRRPALRRLLDRLIGGASGVQLHHENGDRQHPGTDLPPRRGPFVFSRPAVHGRQLRLLQPLFEILPVIR